MKINNLIPTNWIDILKSEKSKCGWVYKIIRIIIKYLFEIKLDCNFWQKYFIINLNMWIIKYDPAIPFLVKNFKEALYSYNTKNIHILICCDLNKKN